MSDDYIEDNNDDLDNNANNYRENDNEWIDGIPTSETENLIPRKIEEIEVKIIGVYEHTENGSDANIQEKYFILMTDNISRKVAIWIGKFEAYSISMAIEQTSLDRPMTHDLIVNIIGNLRAKVDKILIDDIWQETYYAKIILNTQNGRIEIDSRPSDAIAIGLRANASIFMAESVIEQSSIEFDI